MEAGPHAEASALRHSTTDEWVNAGFRRSMAGAGAWTLNALGSPGSANRSLIISWLSG